MIITRRKVKEWLNRYAAPLVLSTSGAIITANLIMALTHNKILAAFAGTWSDNFIFYSFMALKDLRGKKIDNIRTGLVIFIKLIRNLIIEFGPAEYLDSFVLRPFYMAVFPIFISNYSLAILFASLSAEISFFIPTISFYELRKKIFND